MEPVKNYKKKKKKQLLNLKKEGYNISEYENEKNNYLLINKNSYDYDDYNPSWNKGRLRTYSTRYKKNNLNQHHFLPEKEKKSINDRYSERNRNKIKSVYNKSGPKLKQSSKDNKINDFNDYNDSYENYLISPEISLDNKLWHFFNKIELHIESFNTSNVETIKSMFYDCRSLTIYI